MEHKKSSTQTTPIVENAPAVLARITTLDYKEAELFKTAFSQPTTKSPYYRDHATHLKSKSYRGDRTWNPKGNAYNTTFDQNGISFIERDHSENQIKFYKPQELYEKTTIGFKCLICSKETLKENAITSHVRIRYLKN